MGRTVKPCPRCGSMERYYDRNGWANGCKPCHLRRTRSRALKHKQFVDSFKTECADCGTTNDLTFDHVLERGPKLFNVSQGFGMSKQSLLAEIAKCDVVCRSCHMTREHQRGVAHNVGHVTQRRSNSE